ncbi:hypothetical protein E8E11_004765 [Didymella keratinophila]|nr:hypothetical protein E8E11_004765 [Didymella keratinophila]
MPIFIYGGSTATGSLAIQFAKFAGCEVIVTASARNTEYLKSLGADQVFEYKDPDCGSKIRNYTKDKLKMVYDCVAEKGSFDICAAAISSTGGHLVSLLPVNDFRRNDVRAVFRLGYTALGGYYNDDFPARPEDFAFGSGFWRSAESLLPTKKIVPHRIQCEEAGSQQHV